MTDGTNVSCYAVSGRGNGSRTLAEVTLSTVSSDIHLTLTLAILTSIARNAVTDVITRRVGEVASGWTGLWVACALGTVVAGRADVTVVF